MEFFLDLIQPLECLDEPRTLPADGARELPDDQDAIEARRHLRPGERALVFAGARDEYHEVRGAAQVVMYRSAVDLESPKVIEQARSRRLARAIEADGHRVVVRLNGRALGAAEHDEAHVVTEVDDRLEAADRIRILDLELALLDLGGRRRSDSAHQAWLASPIAGWETP